MCQNANAKGPQINLKHLWTLLHFIYPKWRQLNNILFFFHILTKFIGNYEELIYFPLLILLSVASLVIKYTDTKIKRKLIILFFIFFLMFHTVNTDCFEFMEVIIIKKNNSYFL